MSVICIANQKGGVGKTTTTAALAEGLTEFGKRILLVDWDPQGSLTLTCGANPEELEFSIYDALINVLDEKNGAPAAKTILQTENPKIDLLPANIELSQANLDLVNAPERELVLKKALQPLRSSYDFIIIDCLPSLGLMTINALAAADSVIIPLQADFLAMKGLAQLLDIVISVKERLNPSLEIGGILFTMTDPRTLHCKEVIDVTRRAFGGRIRVFDTLVPISVRFKEAPAAGKSILTYAGSSAGAGAYRMFTREVLNEKS